MSFHSERGGRHLVCISNEGAWRENSPILFSMKIGSDNMDEPKLGSILKTEHLDPLHEKAKKILKGIKKIINSQDDDIYKEDENAKAQMGVSRVYYYMCVAQIVIVIILGLYQIYSFRKYLSSNFFI